jgi:hypothetical protein
VKVKLIVTPKGEQHAVDTKEKHRKTGKRSKNKGNEFERNVAKKFKENYGEELMRTPQSGGFAKKTEKADDFRGDIIPVDKTIDLKLHIECKNAKSWSLPAWIAQSKSDCPKGKIPVVVFHQHGTSTDYVTLSLEDFFKLVAKNKIILKKEM